MLVASSVLVGVAGAQDGRRADTLSWSDAPVVPRYRSQADWLVDVGWETTESMYGPFPFREYEVGDEESFFPLEQFNSTPRTFVLRYRTAHAYFWFEPDTVVDEDELAAAAAFFEDHIWPLHVSLFGESWNPGLDGDPRLHILNQREITSRIAGAFNPNDFCPQSLCFNSNQRAIIYINLDTAPLNSESYLTTLAHEHQHLIRHIVDGNEQRWLNEGLSQLTEHFNGFTPRYISGGNMADFLSQPDHHLNGWSSNGYELGRYYGASYLFLVYLYERFGLDYIQQITLSQYDGMAAIQDALVRTGQNVNVDQVFSDWLLANYLDDPYVDGGLYYYQTLDLPIQLRPDRLYPGEDCLTHTDTVNQYGADYLGLIEPGVYDISFDGSDDVLVMGADPASGDYMWWSYNNASSATRLTAAFDLSGLETATLTFDAWWDVENRFDWLQVLVSPDWGISWQVVGGPGAASGGSDAPGAYYTGRSAGWTTEQIDLSAYIGGPVTVRFEYLTDTSNTLSGVALDNLGIVELGFVDDVESPDSPWSPDGFLRIPDTVVQDWTVSIVIHSPDSPPMVQRLPLDVLNTGRASITVPDGGSATIVIGAMAPFTSELADYKVTVQRCAE
ncbi:MAG: hypothetical protein GYB65_16390 [Chloroflexi bacterium]|nr:hypothetical protein [Chloroflexota bacterium]